MKGGSPEVLAVVKDLFFVARIRETARLASVPLAIARSADQVGTDISLPAAPPPLSDSGLRLCPHLRRGRARRRSRRRLHDARARPRDAAVARALRPRGDEGDADGGAADAASGRRRLVIAEEFVSALDAENRSLLDRLAPDDTLKPEVQGELNVVNLLKVALKNEVEATEIAARWLVATDDIDVKMAFARQAGDEAKHYRMIRDRLRALGAPAAAYANPLGKGYGPLFHYLDSLKTIVERVAAGQF